MDEKTINTIMQNMEARTNEELLSIWNEHNTQEWTADAFEAIRRVLVSRGVTPNQPEPAPRREPQPTLDKRSPMIPWGVPRGMTAFKVTTPFRRDFHMPPICTACGAPSSGLTRTVEQQKQYGRTTFTLRLSFPVCRECQEAGEQVVRMGNKATLPGLSMGLLVFAGTFLLLSRAKLDWVIALAASLLTGSVACLIALAIFNKRYSERLPRAIRARSRNLDYSAGIANFRPVVAPQQSSQGDVGAIEFLFTNRRFAEQFARSNGGHFT
jgi:hypothetical protein